MALPALSVWHPPKSGHEHHETNFRKRDLRMTSVLFKINQSIIKSQAVL